FEDHADYADAVEDFLKNGTHAPPQPKPIEIPVGPKASQAARKVREQLKGSIYGAVGPRSMQMWNKISEADFLRVFGIAREGFDGLRLVKMAEKIPTERAEKAVDFLLEKGMELKLGTDPVKSLTRDMVVFQMK